jgi:hypothetical protein
MRFLRMLCALFLMSGMCFAAEKSERPVVEAAYSGEKVVIDGKLDDAVWEKAAAYPMQLPGDQKADPAQPPAEGGIVRLAWNEDFLYIAFDLEDSDIIAESAGDQVKHYEEGDVGEVFIKPLDNSWYWELYVTPRGNKSAYFFPGWGRVGLKSNFEYTMELHTGGAYEGTLNAWQDRDTGWTGEMAVPVRELTRHGGAFGPDSGWTILVARYNYSRYLARKGPEYSAVPQIPRTDYHCLPHYALLRLEKP